jgi:hypothetical protein
MKHLITPIVILITLTFSSYTIGQENFAIDGAKWYYNQQYQLLFSAHGYKLYEVIKDTIVLNQNAKLIQKSFHPFRGNPSITGYEIILNKDRKVYSLKNDQFKLMYDFSLKVSDTLFVDVLNLHCDSISAIIVDSVKTLSFDTINLTSLYLSYTLYLKEEFGESFKNVDNIIERIGNEIQFNYQPACDISDQFVNTTLRCYVDSEIGTYKGYYWKYFHPDKACDSLVDGSIGIDPFLDTDKEITIFPNPTNNTLNILIHSEMKCEVFIYDLLGNLRITIPVEEEAIIDLSFLEIGLYIVKIQQDSRIIVKKIQIIR